jgi:zinc D-Ala-D-Ala dipeptidase
MQPPSQPQYSLGTPLPEETLAALQAVPIHECGEPLVVLQEVCPGVEAGTRPLWLRHSAALRLKTVQEWLDTYHPGYRLRVGDAYRSPQKQAALFRLAFAAARLLHPFWSRARVQEAANRYVAAPDIQTPPPHCTGGAVDVGLLTPRGKRATMGPFLPAATRMDYPHLSPEAGKHRQMLRAAMQAGGFSNYGEEWWHWSYGDSGWALRTGQPAACYGLAIPPEDSAQQKNEPLP